MPSIRISLQAKFNNRLRAIAEDYDISMSDIMNEVAEWVLDQEDEFRIDLERALGFEEVENENEDEEEE